ncbi:MAG: hypothetical protein V3V00_15815 [Saprospiraceae bacterium]
MKIVCTESFKAKSHYNTISDIKKDTEYEVLPTMGVACYSNMYKIKVRSVPYDVHKKHFDVVKTVKTLGDYVIEAEKRNLKHKIDKLEEVLNSNSTELDKMKSQYKELCK